MDTNLLSWDDICILYAGENVVLTNIESDEKGYISRARVIANSGSQTYVQILDAVYDGVKDVQLVAVPPRQDSRLSYGRILGR